jgi:hypothetical protein
MELDPDAERDPDPLVRVTDPGIGIRTKRPRIPNRYWLKARPIDLYLF